MIFYFDRPNSKTDNPFIEYDYIKKLPPQYTLNLLIKDKKNNKKDNKEKNSKSQINSKVNNIQRELINLLSYDLELNNVNEEFQKESNPEINKTEFIKDNNITNLNDNTNHNSFLKKDTRYMNNPINKNKDKINSNNINDQIYFENPRNNKNKNGNLAYNNCSNIENSINNTINNPTNFHIKDQVYYDFKNSHFNFMNICPFIINSDNPINNINKSIINNSLNINNCNLDENINDRFIKIKNKDNYNNYLNVFPKINYEKNKKSFLNNNNLKNRQINIICENNNEDNINSTVNNLNNLNNFQYISNKNNINYTKNINNNNNANFINNMHALNDNTSNISNTLNNDKFNSLLNKYSNMTFLELANKLNIIAKKQSGCRFLENFIQTNENSYEIINKVFFHKLNWEKLLELSNDLFGNYFIQAIIPKLDSNNLVSFTNMVNNNLLKLCLNPHGTRVVQLLIDNIKDNKYNLLILFTKYLSKIMDKLIKDLNGSFVLIHYAEKIKDNDIIYNFLNRNIVEICIRTYSCSALQKFIDLGTKRQKYKLINNIVNNINMLIGNQCGLYVIQFVMNKKDYQINDIILQKIINNLIKYSKQKYSSNVIEKCLETCSPNGVNKIIEILKNDIIIRDLIKDIFGNYVIQKLLIVCPNDNIRSHILGIIASEFNELTKVSFGNQLIKKLSMAYPELKVYLNLNKQ